MNAKVVTIYEDYPNKLSDYSEHLGALNKLRNIIGARYFSLQVDGTLQIMHYVGFFQFGNTRIQILPKVYAKSSPGSLSNSEITDSIGFVYRLLYASGYLNVKKLLPQLQNASGGDLLEIFIEIFISEFIKEFRKNVHRNYIQIEENQQFIKGKIIVSETVRRNPILKHLHYTRFDEFSINNSLNQVFKSLILLLLSKTKSVSNKKKLVIGLTYLQDVELVTLGESHFRKVKFNRLNNSFEPLFNLAKLFFYNQQPGLSEGEAETFSFLVPMHTLFERYLATIFDSFSNTSFTFHYHCPRYYLGKEGNKNVFQLEPDFTVFSGSRCICILDAKYKYPFKDSEENENPDTKVSTSDLYQLCTYALRYSSKILVLIYPKFVGSPKDDSIISEYEIQSESGLVKLLIVQIDIIEKDMESISSNLYHVLTPYFDLELIGRESV